MFVLVTMFFQTLLQARKKTEQLSLILIRMIPSPFPCPESNRSGRCWKHQQHPYVWWGNDHRCLLWQFLSEMSKAPSLESPIFLYGPRPWSSTSFMANSINTIKGLIWFDDEFERMISQPWTGSDPIQWWKDDLSLFDRMFELYRFQYNIKSNISAIRDNEGNLIIKWTRGSMAGLPWDPFSIIPMTGRPLKGVRFNYNYADSPRGIDSLIPCRSSTFRIHSIEKYDCLNSAPANGSWRRQHGILH